MSINQFNTTGIIATTLCSYVIKWEQLLNNDTARKKATTGRYRSELRLQPRQELSTLLSRRIIKFFFLLLPLCKSFVIVSYFVFLDYFSCLLFCIGPRWALSPSSTVEERRGAGGIPLMGLSGSISSRPSRSFPSYCVIIFLCPCFSCRGGRDSGGNIYQRLKLLFNSSLTNQDRCQITWSIIDLRRVWRPSVIKWGVKRELL